MRKFYMILVLVAVCATTSMAQVDGSTVCLKGDSISITFDYSQNCPAAPGDFSGMTEIGFHSGVNGWTTGVDWDAANAVRAINNGNDVFTLDVDYTYYGLVAADSLVDLQFVFNQGPTDANSPWGSEGKADNDGDGSCDNFMVTIADLEECATSTNDVKFEGQVTIAPNPMVERTALRFDNPNNEVFDMAITNLTGQVIRTQNGIKTNFINIERGEMTSGVYFITLRNAEGATITEKLIVQ
ncbi:MAG: T9SS type A sorting domain-containing protein [Saprospiraceae bacterium]